MEFATFFSRQARRPSGLFGRFVMSVVFDRGNAFLNGFVLDAMAVQEDDRVLEIGCGTGRLIGKMAKSIDRGYIEGVDFSDAMVAIARRRNRDSIASGQVKITKGDFDELEYECDCFDKVCSVNTVYFWPRPESTATRIADVLVEILLSVARNHEPGFAPLLLFLFSTGCRRGEGRYRRIGRIGPAR